MGETGGPGRRDPALAWLLTQDATGGPENSPPLPQPHGPAHLPGVMLRHVDHLWKHAGEGETLSARLRSAERPLQGPRTTGCLVSGWNSVELASTAEEETEIRKKFLSWCLQTREGWLGRHLPSRARSWRTHTRPAASPDKRLHKQTTQVTDGYPQWRPRNNTRSHQGKVFSASWPS